MNELKKSTDSKMTVTKYEDLDKHFHSAMQVVDDIVLKKGAAMNPQSPKKEPPTEK